MSAAAAAEKSSIGKIGSIKVSDDRAGPEIRCKSETMGEYGMVHAKAEETWSKQKSGPLSLKAGQRIFAQQGQKGQRQKGTFDL